MEIYSIFVLISLLLFIGIHVYVYYNIAIIYCNIRYAYFIEKNCKFHMERETARSIIFNKVPMKDNTITFQILLIVGLIVTLAVGLFCLLYIEKLEGEFNLILLIFALYICTLVVISKNYKNLTLNSDNLSRLHKKYYDTLQQVINLLIAPSSSEHISVFSKITLTDIQPPETNTRKFQWALIKRILREDNNTTLDEAVYQFNNYISNEEYLKLIGYIEFDNNAPAT